VSPLAFGKVRSTSQPGTGSLTWSLPTLPTSERSTKEDLTLAVFEVDLCMY
jgi:hypothetical protein